MWAKISKLWLKTCIAVSFRYTIVCVLTHITQKLQVVYGHPAYRITALLSEMPIFWVRAACEIRLVSYGYKHASQSLSNKPFACTCRHNLKTIPVVNGCSTYHTIALLLESSLYGLELHDRSEWRATAPDMHCGHSLRQHCVHMLQTCTYIAIWCATMHDNKTHIPYDCILHTKWWLYCQQCIIL